MKLNAPCDPISEIFSFATTSGQVGSLSDTGLPITEERPGTQTGQLFSLHLGVTPGLTKTTLPLAPRKMTRVPTTITELPDAQIFMGHSGDIYAPADHLQRASTSARKLHAQSRKNQNKSSLFNDIFEGHKPPRSRKQQPVDSPYQPSSKTSPAAALSQPAHLMPPLTQLWQEAILLPPPRQPAAVTDPTADGSIPMDEDDVQDPVASALPDGDATQHQQTPLAARNITLHPAPAELLTGLARRL